MNSDYHSTTMPWLLSTRWPYLESQRKMLEENFRVVVWKDYIENPDAYRHKIEGLLHIPAYKPKIPEELLRSMPNLKVLATHSTGTNHLDVPLLRRLGIKIGHARGILDDTCADFAFALLLAVARRIPECIEQAQGYEENDLSLGWYKPNLPPAVTVSGTTLGILGMGRIGLEVARRSSGFKMRVLYHNRNRRSEADETEVRATYYPSLDEMLPEVDFLVITASLNDTSKHLVGRKQLGLMKSSAIMVNIGRGMIIDQDAMIDSLRNGKLFGVALDATYPEPLHKDHPLLHMSNVIVTAHLAAMVGETLDRVLQNCIDNLKAGIEGRPLVTEIPSDH